jgi:hypothetical protein
LYVVGKLEGIEEFAQIKAFLKTYDKEAFDSFDEVPIDIEKRKAPKLELPEGFNLLALGKSQYGKMARNYMRGRGFKIMDLTLQGVGYCDSGPLEGYIIFPFVEAGELIYYQSRNFSGFGPKFNNPGEEEIGRGKTEIMYNKEGLYRYKKIYIVESVINALTLGDNAIALLGKFASLYQLNQILKSPCEEVVIVLDPDALEKAVDLALKLVEHKKVKLLNMPEEQDVNSMGKKYVRGLEKEASYLSFGQLLSIKNNL